MGFVDFIFLVFIFGLFSLAFFLTLASMLLTIEMVISFFIGDEE